MFVVQYRLLFHRCLEILSSCSIAGLEMCEGGIVIIHAPPQRLNDDRCYSCHVQWVEQSYIDTNENYFALPVCCTKFMDPDKVDNNGDCGCIVLCRIFAETVTDGIDLTKHWLLFHWPQTSSSVTAVYHVHTPEYLQLSLNPNHSWQETWMQFWFITFCPLTMSTAL